MNSKWTGNSFLLGSSSLANQAGSFYLSLHCYCWWCVMVLRGFFLLAKSHQKIKQKTKTENEVIYFGFQSLIFKRNCKVFIFDFSKLPNIGKMLNFLTLLSFACYIWPNLPMADGHFGYINIHKRNTGP